MKQGLELQQLIKGYKRPSASILVCPVRMHFTGNEGNSNRQRRPLVRSHASRAYFVGSNAGFSRESNPATAGSRVNSTGCCHSNAGTSLQAQSNDSIQTTMGGIKNQKLTGH